MYARHTHRRCSSNTILARMDLILCRDILTMVSNILNHRLHLRIMPTIPCNITMRIRTPIIQRTLRML